MPLELLYFRFAIAVTPEIYAALMIRRHYFHYIASAIAVITLS